MSPSGNVAWLAIVAVPITWILTVTSAVIWNETAEEPSEPPAMFQGIVDWIKEELPLFRYNEPMWGWRELLWLGPALAIPAAFRVAQTTFPTKVGLVASRVMAWSFALATVLVAAVYLFGFGWPGDLAAILVATMAATITGASSLRQGGPLPTGAALGLSLAVLLMPPLFIAGLAYPSPAVFLGLIVSLAWCAVGMAAHDARALRSSASAPGRAAAVGAAPGAPRPGGFPGAPAVAGHVTVVRPPVVAARGPPPFPPSRVQPGPPRPSSPRPLPPGGPPPRPLPGRQGPRGSPPPRPPGAPGSPPARR